MIKPLYKRLLSRIRRVLLLCLCLAMVALGLAAPSAVLQPITIMAEEIEEEDALPRIDEFFGAGNILPELEAHTDDEKYLGTPGWPQYTDGAVFTDVCYYGTAAYNKKHHRTEGINAGGAGALNCAGFIASIFLQNGADLTTDFITGCRDDFSINYTNAINWQYTLCGSQTQGEPNRVLHYTYYSIADLIADGKARKGDILFIEPDYDASDRADVHMLFYWGPGSVSVDSVSDTKNAAVSDTTIKVWHSVGYFQYVNRIEEIDQNKLCEYTGSVAKIYLLPVTHYGKLSLEARCLTPNNVPNDGTTGGCLTPDVEKSFGECLTPSEKTPSEKTPSEKTPSEKTPSEMTPTGMTAMGAIYRIYSDPGCTKRVKVRGKQVFARTDPKGHGHFYYEAKVGTTGGRRARTIGDTLELPEGTYYLKAWKQLGATKLSRTVIRVRIKEGKTKKLQVKELQKKVVLKPVSRLFSGPFSGTVRADFT